MRVGVIVLHVVNFGGGGTGYDRCVQHDNPVMRGPHADFVFGAKHPERFDSAYLRFLDFETFFLADGIEHGSDLREDHFLSGGHVGGAAHDLQRLGTVADGYGGHVQVVGVGMLGAGQHLGDDKPLQSATDALHFLDPFDLQPRGSQYLGGLPGGQIGLDIIFQPVV